MSASNVSAPATRTSLEWSAVAATAIWGGAFTAVKVAIETFGVVTVAEVRLALGTAVLFALVRRAELPTGPQARGDLVRLALAGFTFGAIQVVWGIGLQYTTASQASVLFATSPVLTALFALALRLEAVRPKTLAGIALCFGGVTAMIGPDGSDLGTGQLFGNLLCLIGAASWAVCTLIIAPLLTRYSPLKQSAYMLLFAALMVLPVSVPELPTQPWLSAPFFPGWFALVLSGIGPIAVGQWLWAVSIKRIGATRTMVYYYLQPVFGVILATLLLNERLAPLQIAGAAAVLYGIFLARTR